MRGKKVTKICKGCGISFEALAIKVRQGKGKFHSKKCYNDWRSSRKEDKKTLQRYHQIKHRYGLSRKDYLTMKENQQNKCSICNDNLDTVKECVDHDHDTGKVRSLLCNSCNTLLGMCRENTEILENAITYIKENWKVS